VDPLDVGARVLVKLDQLLHPLRVRVVVTEKPIFFLDLFHRCLKTGL
jgi:hypothetical protein